MARPIKHDGGLYKRPGSKVWWMRYRDKAGQRQRESTRTEDWDEAQRSSENVCKPGTTTPFPRCAEGRSSHLGNGRSSI